MKYHPPDRAERHPTPGGIQSGHCCEGLDRLFYNVVEIAALRSRKHSRGVILGCMLPASNKLLPQRQLFCDYPLADGLILSVRETPVLEFGLHLKRLNQTTELRSTPIPSIEASI